MMKKEKEDAYSSPLPTMIYKEADDDMITKIFQKIYIKIKYNQNAIYLYLSCVVC